MANKVFTFEDIVRDAVKKEIGRTATGGSGDFMSMLGVKDLNDITKFIQALQGLTKMNQPPARIAPDRNSSAGTPTSQPSPSPAMSINPEMVYSGLLNAFDGLIAVGGDMKLSEAKAFLETNKKDVLALIQAQVAAMYGGTQ